MRWPIRWPWTRSAPGCRRQSCMRRRCAPPFHICTGTGRPPSTFCTGKGSAPSMRHAPTARPLARLLGATSMHCVCVFRPGLYRMQCAWRGRGAARCVVGRLPVSRVVCTLQAKKVDAKMKLWCTVADSVRLIVEGTSALRPFVAHQPTNPARAADARRAARSTARTRPFLSARASVCRRVCWMERAYARAADALLPTVCRRGGDRPPLPAEPAAAAHGGRWGSLESLEYRSRSRAERASLVRWRTLEVSRFVPLRAPSLRQPRSAQTATVEAPAAPSTEGSLVPAGFAPS